MNACLILFLKPLSYPKYVGFSIKTEIVFSANGYTDNCTLVHQLITVAKTNIPVYVLIIFKVFLLVLSNPEIVSLKITDEKMSDENSENLHER